MTTDSNRGGEAHTSQPAATDFLSSLLDRALGRAPVLERRRPALFEPPRTLMPLDRKLLEPTLEERVLEQDSPTETPGKESAVHPSAAAPPAHTELISTETSPSQSARSVAPLLTETELQREVRSDLAFQSAPVENRPTFGAREAQTAPLAPRKESAPAQNSSAAPFVVSETIIERQVEIRVPDSNREHQPPEHDRPTPGRQLPSASPITTVATHPLNRERDDKETTRPRTSDIPEPRMPVEHIRDTMKAPVAIVTPQTSVASLVSPVTQLERAAKKDPAPAQKIEPRITLEPKPAKPANLRPIPVQRVSASAAAPASPQQTTPVEPTIQVTIGRVEVRATLPASQPRVARPATPKLSLEDYLKWRSGGVK